MRSRDIIDHEKANMLLDVIRQSLLPNLSFESIGAIGGEHTIKAKSVSLRLTSEHSLFSKSYLDVPVPSGLIHYTKIDSLLKILKSKKIRLSCLTSVDDLHEYGFARRVLSPSEFVHSFYEAKNNVFSLSMCSESVETKEKSLNMWRQYADDGRGVGIVFKIKSLNRLQWHQIHLSKVLYGEKALLPLTAFQKNYEEFIRLYDFSCSNIGEALHPIFAFHKARIYSEEKEYRLIYTYEKNRGIFNPNEELAGNKRYVELNLEREIVPSKAIREMSQKTFGYRSTPIYQPKISISRLYFGYRLIESEKKQLTKEINSLLEEFNCKPIFLPSCLTKYFQ